MYRSEGDIGHTDEYTSCESTVLSTPSSRSTSTCSLQTPRSIVVTNTRMHLTPEDRQRPNTIRTLKKAGFSELLTLEKHISATDTAREQADITSKRPNVRRRLIIDKPPQNTDIPNNRTPNAKQTIDIDNTSTQINSNADVAAAPGTILIGCLVCKYFILLNE